MLFDESQIGRSRYPDSVNKRSITEGTEFQDYVMDVLQRRLGLSISVYGSKTFQLMKGESVQGIEIKLDNLWTRTDRLSIEIAEKSRAANPYYVWSGIFAPNKTWLYIQGNPSGFYIFMRHHLQWAYQQHTAAGKAGILPNRYINVNGDLPWNRNRTARQMEVSVKPTIISYYLDKEFADLYGYFVSN